MILPLNVTFNEFFSQIRVDLPHIDFPNPPDVKNWISFAQSVVNNNDLVNVPLPTETAYKNEEDWKIWAAYFIDSVYNRP